MQICVMAIAEKILAIKRILKRGLYFLKMLRVMTFKTLTSWCQMGYKDHFSHST